MMQGSIWSVNLDQTIGAEIKKTRPCVIISSNKVGKLPLKVIAQITDHQPHYAFVPWMVTVNPSKINGLSKVSVIDLFQVRSVSQKRLIQKVGNVSNDIVKKCRTAIDVVFEID